MAEKSGLRRWTSLGEGRIDRLIARDLFDRVCVENVEWLDGQLELIRQWTLELTWKDAKEPVGVAAFRFGRFDGLPRNRDAYALFKHATRAQLEGTEFLVALRDADGDTERLSALEEALRDERFPRELKVLIGVPSFEVEAWILAGFLPTPAEESLVASERARLGFDLIGQAERLTGRADDHQLSAKRALRALSAGDHDRERQCWRETSLGDLRRNGASNGLADFLERAAQAALALFEPR